MALFQVSMYAKLTIQITKTNLKIWRKMMTRIMKMKQTNNISQQKENQTIITLTYIRKKRFKKNKIEI